MTRAPGGVGRFAAGDGLRALAAATVVGFHAATLTGQLFDRGGPYGAFGRGAEVLRGLDVGVYVFFVLSGYLLARPFARVAILGGAFPSVPDYARNRLLRIVPAFWVVVTLTLLIRGTHATPPAEVLAIYGFAQVYVPSAASAEIIQAWTLDIELAFYLALPLAGLAAVRLVRGSPGARTALLLAALAIVAAASFAARADGPGLPFLVTPPEMVWAFVPGMVLAVLEPLAIPWLRHREAVARALPWLLLAIVVPAFAGYCVSSPADIGARYGFGAVLCGALVAAPLVTEWAGGRPWRVFDNRAMRWLGERSYGIYLVHLLVLAEVVDAVGRRATPWRTLVLVTVIAVPLIALAAAASWRWVERPALAHRHRWRGRAAADPA